MHSTRGRSSCNPKGSLRVPGETPRRLAPVPPPQGTQEHVIQARRRKLEANLRPRDAEEPGFSRAQCFTHRGQHSGHMTAHALLH